MTRKSGRVFSMIVKLQTSRRFNSRSNGHTWSLMAAAHLMGLLTKETCLVLLARCRLWLMRARLLRMGSTATTRLPMAATITVYIPADM